MVRWRSEVLFLGQVKDINLAGDATRSLEAGFVSLFLLFAALSTFGVWFSLSLAYVLTGASVVVGLLGLHWAHQAFHVVRRNPGLDGKVLGLVGAALALVGVFASSYVNGFLLLMVHPVAWVFWIAIGMTLLPNHFERKSQEAKFLMAYDARAGTSACARCDRRIVIDDGSWTDWGWVCGACSSGEEA